VAVKDSDISTLLSSASLVLAGGILGSASKLIERIIVARTFSPDAYGEVSIALTVLTFSVTMAMVGFNQGVPRYVSRFDDERNVRGVWVTGLLVPGLVSLLVVAALVLNAEWIAGRFFEGRGTPELLILFVLAIPFTVGSLVGIGTIRGLENTIYKTYAQDLFHPGVRIALLVGLLGVGLEIDAVGYAYLLTAVGFFVFTHVLLNRLMPLVGEFETHVAEMVKFSAPLVISTLLARLLTKTDTLMMGYFRPSFEVGQYSAAFPLANGMVIILSAFGFIYLPLTSRMDANGEREEIDAIYKLTTKWIFVITFPLFVTLVLFPGDVLGAVFGSEYRQAALPLTILSLGFFTNAAGGRNRETLSALGYTGFILLTNAIAFALNFALNLLLIPRYGAEGAAVASAASYVTLNLSVIAILALKFDISPFSRWSVRTFVVLPTVVLPVAALLSRWVSLSALTLLPFMAVVGIASVYLAAVTGCLQPQDEIPLELVEDRVGITLPYLRRFIPEE